MCPLFLYRFCFRKKGMTLLSLAFIFLSIILVFSSAGVWKPTGHCSHFKLQNKTLIGDCIEFQNLVDLCVTQVGSQDFY